MILNNYQVCEIKKRMEQSFLWGLNSKEQRDGSSPALWDFSPKRDETWFYFTQIQNPAGIFLLQWFSYLLQWLTWGGEGEGVGECFDMWEEVRVEGESVASWTFSAGRKFPSRVGPAQGHSPARKSSRKTRTGILLLEEDQGPPKQGLYYNCIGNTSVAKLQ